MAYEKFVQIEKFGVIVWAHRGMDEMRKSECMCRQCEKCGPCEIAQRAYQLCKETNLAFSVTRCPEFKEGKPQIAFQ